MDTVSQVDNLLQAVLSRLSMHDKVWIRRKRKITTSSVFFFLILRVGGGTKRGLKRVIDLLASLGTEEFAGYKVAGSSMVVARKKAGWKIFRILLYVVVDFFEAHFEKKNFFGKAIEYS